MTSVCTEFRRSDFKISGFRAAFLLQSSLVTSVSLQLRFYKIILKLSKSTLSCMVYGGLGQFPLEVQAKCRMLSFYFLLML